MPYPKIMDLSVKQLLERFPEGFVVSPEGELYEVIEARRRPQDLPALLRSGGYLAVRSPELKLGDEFYGQAGSSIIQRLTPSEMADELDRLIKLADTIEEDAILAKLYTTYSERLEYAVKQLLGDDYGS